VTKPDPGQRQRILTPRQTARLLRAADRAFRPFLLAMRHTIARPQGVRAFQWKHLTTAPVPMFVLRDFKARKRRKDKAAVRMFPLDGRMLRLLARLARGGPPSPEGFVFLNSDGRPMSLSHSNCPRKLDCN
jgi:hypothetical protein